ncbi:exosortase XrtG [Enterococcus sp. 10A9_DIV0425]|uniref:Exosortase XrtG n=1 Tax=Candidatus Enterococcus wittei TaxID=1987383 RepID=A0A242JYT0_9ENTE|nr:exosortase family protein XrtG [Enterococcus sp. 10A9_DIV0425]OTP10478.1 exosortase XrtG [Enterococcus sp. 10A9_DIV0425]THE12890.1 exosortase family protein XrtG [Enterococcus hirae]
MNLYILIGLVIWLYILSVMKRSRLLAFHFILGSVGLFYLLILFSRPYWVWFLTQLVIKTVDFFGSIPNITEEFSQYSLIFIHSAKEPLSLYVDYECSGVIETSAFLGLLAFYPLYNRKEKFFYGIFGILWIFISNVIRLLLVIAFVHFGGSDFYFFAHSILGRLIFYGLVIILYYHTFTYSQVARSLYEKKNRLFKKGGK